MRKLKHIFLIILIIFTMAVSCDTGIKSSSSYTSDLVSSASDNSDSIESSNIDYSSAYISSSALLYSSATKSQASVSNTSSFKPYVKPLPPDIEIQQKGSVLEISSMANADKLNGFGAEWDPHFWMEYNTKYGVGESDWKKVTNRILELGIDRVRVSWVPFNHEIINDNDDPDVTNMDMFFLNEHNQELASLKRQLDFCQKNGIKVTLAYWGPTWRSWIGSNYSGNWWNAPYSASEYAENISVLLKHLIVDCKYTVIDEFCAFNEPSLGYYNKNGRIVFSEFASMMKILDTRLEKDGIRNKVKLIGSDDSSTRMGKVGTGNLYGLPWFEDSAKALNKICQAFSTHSYRFLLQDSNKDIAADMKAYFNTLKKYAPDKPLVVHEFGTANTMGAYHVNDLETYERALFLPKFAINLLNAGGAGALYWIMYDQLYYEGLEKDAKMATGLWAFKTENWRIRKMYHSWGLVTKHTSPGSLIYAGESQDLDLCIVALKDKDGFATYMIVNTAKTSKYFTIKTPVTKREFLLVA